MRVHKSKAVVAGVAVIALAAAAACSSSKSSGGSGGSGGSSGSSSATDPTAGTKGTGNFADCATKPNDCNSGTAKQGGTFTYTIEKTITGWNINTANTNTFDIAEVFGGISPGVWIANPDFKPSLNTDLMVSADSAVAGGVQTITYKINPDAVWSDGTPINFADFKYQKDTSDGVTCPNCGPATTAGYDQIASITSADNGKTVIVKMKKTFADWQTMFGTLYPAHIAAQHGSLTTAAGLTSSFTWFDKNKPTWSGGPYIISKYDTDTAVTEVPNPKWYGKIKPPLDKLIFRIITDQTQEIPALQNGEVDAIYPQPNADLVQQANALPNTQSYLGKGLNWEHLDFNTTSPLLKDVTLRTAIFTAINRQNIITRTVGQFVPNAQPDNNHMYVPGQPGYVDNITKTGQGGGDVAAAKKLLTDAKYTGVGSALKNPSGAAVNIRCTFTAGNTLRQQTCQIIQSQLKQLGITVTLNPTDDLGGTLDKGDFDLIIFAWVSTPYAVSGAQQIWKLKGGGDYGKNSNPAMEKLLDEAAVSTDQTKIQSLLNQADVLLTKDAYVLPLFQKPTFLVTTSNAVNIRDNATSAGPPYNVQAWGVK